MRNSADITTKERHPEGWRFFILSSSQQVIRIFVIFVQNFYIIEICSLLKVKVTNHLNHFIDAGYNANEGKGWRGFWYASKGYFDLSNPESILKPIWRIAHPEEANKPQAII